MESYFNLVHFTVNNDDFGCKKADIVIKQIGSWAKLKSIIFWTHAV